LKSAAPATVTTITSDHANTVGHVVRAEWRHNRFYKTLVDNTPTEDSSGYDIELFPIESITKPNRPKKSGIVKAVVGQATVAQNRYDSPPAARYYTVDPDDEYKYWQSPESSGASTPFDIANCAPQVLYVQEDGTTLRTVKTNKIQFTIENTYAQPDAYTVQIKTSTGGSWTTVSTNPSIPSTGRVELWYNGTNWTTTPNYANVIDVHAVRLVVTSMNKQAYFNLIELGLCLELDVTADVVNWSDNFTMAEDDFITPLGTISSNTASLTLFDDANTYDNDNASSILYGLLDKGVIFRGFMKYGSDLVQEFEMYSDIWSASEDSTVVNLIDESTFFMSTKPRPVLYRNIPVQEAVWRVCDIIGFNNYNVTAMPDTPHSNIDIFWTDGEKTAWEIFQELSRATQTAIYFDSYGVLQVKTRDAAFNSTATPVYSFIRDSVPGGQPSNVVSLTDDNEYQANKVLVNWHPSGFSEQRDNIIPFEVVWEPDGTVLLRSSDLAKNLLVGGTTLVLPTKVGKAWPWNGMCNIEGEWISFDAKQYIYYDASGVRQTTWVEDHEAQKRLDEATPANKKHLNTYTGTLRIKERGLFNTEERNHYIDLDNWTKGRQRNYGSTNSPCSGIKLNKGQSSVTISSPKNSDMADYTYLYRGNAINTGFWYLGTRLKVNKTSHKDKCGGIFFNADTALGAGYFVEVMATANMNGKMRHTRNEVIFYSQKSDGSKKVFGGEKVVMKDKSKNNKKDAKTKTDVGAEMAVPMDRWIDIDIWFSVVGGDDHIQIWANGSFLFEAVVPSGSGWQHSRVERSGLYVRGHSSLDFDYFYGINNLGVDPVDGESYFDRIEGAYRGNQAIADWTYEVRKVRRKIRKKWTKVKQKYNQRFYDEFGPMVHEIREFKVKFTSDTPVLQSRLYFSNHTQVVCPEYVGDISGAHFLLANIDRRDAVVSGDDEVTAMGNGTINHKLFVYGRPVIQKDVQTIEKNDEWAQRRRGIIEVEYDSNWIQNETEANNFADWLTTHWSTSDSKVEAEVFGNPLIELGDVVSLTYKNMTNVKFYVIGVANTYDNGLTTNLTLRRAV
jgi:hypothetical protein